MIAAVRSVSLLACPTFYLLLALFLFILVLNVLLPLSLLFVVHDGALLLLLLRRVVPATFISATIVRTTTISNRKIYVSLSIFVLYLHIT